jgi:hypothetical protein
MNIIDIPKIDWLDRFTNRYNSPIYRYFFKKDIKRFESLIFPIIKNYSYPSLASELIQVQPMNDCPSGQVFYLDFIKDNKKWWQFWKKL